MMHKPTQLFQVKFQPVFYFLLLFIVGILVEKFFHFPKIAFFIITFTSLIVASICYKLKMVSHITTTAILIGFVSIGFCLASIEYEKTLQSSQLVDKYIYSSLKETNIELYGQITSYPVVTPNYIYVSLDTGFIRKFNKAITLTTKVKLIFWLNNSNTNQILLVPGNIIHVFAEVNPEQKFKNPGVINSRQLLSQQGYDFSAHVKDFALVEILDKKETYSFFAKKIYQTRCYVFDEIDKNFNQEKSSILKAIILGEGHYLSSDITEKFRVTGLYHILIISGSHFAFLTWILYRFLSVFTRHRLIKCIIIVLSIWSYALLTGAETPVLRAVLMVTATLIGTLFYRQVVPSNTIAIAGLILLSVHTSALFEASFQLTFLAVVTILLIVFPVVNSLSEIGKWYPTRRMPYPPRCHKSIKWLAELVFWSEKSFIKNQSESTIKYKLEKNIWAKKLESLRLQKTLQLLIITVFSSFIIQLGLIPLSIIYFNRVALIGTLLGFFTELIMSCLLVIFSIFVLLNNEVTHFFNYYIIILINILIDLFINVSYPQCFSSLIKIFPFLSYRLAGFHGWKQLYYLFYYLCYISFIVKINKWQPFSRQATKKIQLSSKILVILYIMCLLVVIIPQNFYSTFFNNKDRKLEIVFLDVGQGDAIFVKFPLGTTMMIDSGGKIPIKSKEAQSVQEFSIGEDVDSKYLWQRDIEYLDYILLTHPHSDHMQGFNEIIENFYVKKAILPVNPNPTGEWQNFFTKLINAHIPVNIWSKGQIYFIDGVKIEVLWPVKDIGKKQAGNNQSLVLRLDYQGHKILLTGDIEREVEEFLANSEDDLSAEILKVPHHGSKTSSTWAFLQKVNPKFAIISAPAKSMFNHPHQEVVERYKDLGVKTYQTGLKGAISLYVESDKVEIKEFIER